MSSKISLEEVCTSKPSPYQTLEEKSVYQGRWVRVIEVGFIDPATKSQGVWECVYRQTKRPGAQVEGVDVLGIHRDAEGTKSLILVKQYRIPVKGWTLELPAGLLDAAESVEECALRELKEETGFTASRVVRVSQGVNHLDPGMTDDSVAFVTLEVDGTEERNAAPKQALEQGEAGLQVVLLPLASLRASLEAVAAAGVHVEAKLYTLAQGLAMAQDFGPL